MQIFGKSAAEGRFKYNDGKANIDYKIEKIKSGFKIIGKARGRLRRIEVFRSPAPKELLLNNWQSWGPLLKMEAKGKHEGIEYIFREYSPYVFTPIPETFLRNLVSDYFVAWEGYLAGFFSSRFAHPFFAVEGAELVAYLEYFDTKFEEAIPLEPFVIFDGSSAKIESSDAPVAALNKGKIIPTPSFSLPQEDNIESLLEEYADLAAAENRVKLSAWNPVGWSSWYHYFTKLRWEDIEKNLCIARKDFPFEVFQIDDGYEKDIGDWLEAKEGFRTLPELAQLIKGHGFVAGIWTAPFSVSESSRLFQEHRDWMVKDAGRPKECYKGWGKKTYALDTTRPEVKTWLVETFSSLKKMGFDYFKIDFLFAAAMPGERAKNVTPVQAYREGMEAIRQAVGKSFILGCGAPLLPSIGFVEGMRVGEDTASSWDTSRSPFQGANAYHALKNSIMRSFMHRRWWLNDPDCLLLRNKDIELKPNERELYALVAGALDNLIIESDDLELVDAEGRKLLERAISLKGGRVKVNGLLEDEFYEIQSRGGQAGDFRLLANLSDSSKYYESSEIPPRSARFSYFTSA
jgi:alpha-galactosidase